jgi:hypothetical protein
VLSFENIENGLNYILELSVDVWVLWGELLRTFTQWIKGFRRIFFIFVLHNGSKIG